MKHISVAWKLKEIADLLELLGESTFKVRAYRQAAVKLEELSEDIEQIFSDGRLMEIDGIGKSIAGRIEEILQTGDSAYLKELKQQIPEDLGDLLDIPGLGPKLARRIRESLGITSVTELEAALQAKKIREIPGFDSRTELRIMRAIKEMRTSSGEMLLGAALPYSRELISRLKRISGTEQIVLTGSGRRGQEIIERIEILALAEKPDKLLEALLNLPESTQVLERSPARAAVLTIHGIRLDLFTASSENFPVRLLTTTGPASHVDLLKERANQRGLALSDDALLDKGERRIPLTAEEEIYAKLGLKYIIPELREDVHILRAAEEGLVPHSLTHSQIKGDLHVHTRWSDGVNTIEEMVKTAQALGYEYLAICDHSRALKIAKGMSLEVFQEQLNAIDELNARLQGFQILKGIEVDILKDGVLDYPNEVLARLDVVVASVHTGFGGSEEELTSRIITAMQNPYVHIIGHPTGRLLKRREPYKVNLERVFQAAKETGTVLEINATPDRLDLADTYVKMCKALGVKLAVNTDAHSVEQLGYMEYGVLTARRGWLEEVDVINTYSLMELKTFLSL